jgi:hypothetical protein
MAKGQPDPNVTIMVTNNGMGQAAPELTQKLLITYLQLLDLEDRLPTTICFYTEGIHMVLVDSPVLEELQALAQRGIRLVVCGTCVNFYGVKDRMAVGEIGSMKDIMAAQWNSAKVITL